MIYCVPPFYVEESDKIKDLTFGEYYELLMSDKINKWENNGKQN